MRSGFRPHDRDRTTESMEGVWIGFGPLWKGVGLQDKRGFTVPRLTIGVSNGLQMAGNLTGGLTDGVPRPLGKYRSTPRKFNTRT